MNIIKNIKIKYKLLLLVLLPIVFLLIMFIKISFDGFEQKQKAEILNKKYWIRYFNFKNGASITKWERL